MIFSNGFLALCGESLCVFLRFKRGVLLVFYPSTTVEQRNMLHRKKAFSSGDEPDEEDTLLIIWASASLWFNVYLFILP